MNQLDIPVEQTAAWRQKGEFDARENQLDKQPLGDGQGSELDVRVN